MAIINSISSEDGSKFHSETCIIPLSNYICYAEVVFPCKTLKAIMNRLLILLDFQTWQKWSNMLVFLIKTANSIMPSHPGPQTNIVRWLDSNFLSRRYFKQRNTDAYRSLFVTIDYTLDVLLAIPYLGSMLVTGKLTKPPEVRHWREAHSYSHIVEIDTHFSADTSKKVTVTWFWHANITEP